MSHHNTAGIWAVPSKPATCTTISLWTACRRTWQLVRQSGRAQPVPSSACCTLPAGVRSPIPASLLCLLCCSAPAATRWPASSPRARRSSQPSCAGGWAFEISSVGNGGTTANFNKGGNQEARGNHGCGAYYVEGIAEELDAPCAPKPAAQPQAAHLSCSSDCLLLCCCRRRLLTLMVCRGEWVLQERDGKTILSMIPPQG